MRGGARSGVLRCPAEGDEQAAQGSELRRLHRQQRLRGVARAEQDLRSARRCRSQTSGRHPCHRRERRGGRASVPLEYFPALRSTTEETVAPANPEGAPVSGPGMSCCVRWRSNRAVTVALTLQVAGGEAAALAVLEVLAKMRWPGPRT